MKKMILFTSLILLSGLTFAQNLQKGNVLGFHNSTFIPNQDVSLNQCISFMKDKYLPAVEKNLPGVKCYVLKGIRGERVDSISIVYVFQSDEIRNKYWKGKDDYTELGNAAVENMKPLRDEMGKYGKMIDKYTDWVIQ